MSLLNEYAKIAGDDVIAQLRQLAAPLTGATVTHISSVCSGHSVDDSLNMLVPLTRELGIKVHWKTLTENSEFTECIRGMYNTLQGTRGILSERLLKVYEDTNAINAENLRQLLEQSDYVFIHDPQPAPLLYHCPNRRGKWIWRCHIDTSRPYRPIWKYIYQFVAPFDASIFSHATFTRILPHPQYLISPSIDPLSDKNKAIGPEIIREFLNKYQIDEDRPLIAQIARIDRFRDPLGVIQAYQMVKQIKPKLQLVLAGDSTTDDPDDELILHQVQTAARNDPDLHLLLFPSDASLEINAIQRAADIIIHKSIREGFGLSVAEAMWKYKPVIGGNAGGIGSQVINHHTGFLVNTPEGAALRTRYLLNRANKMKAIGVKAHKFIRDNFIITRHMREHLTLMVALMHGKKNLIELK